jgi:hypothetical protein
MSAALYNFESGPPLPLIVASQEIFTRPTFLDRVLDALPRVYDPIDMFYRIVGRAEALRDLVNWLYDLLSQLAHMIQLRSRS